MALFRVIADNFINAKRTWGMALIDLKKRYSSSALGWFWAIVKPALFVLVYWFGIQVGIRGGAATEDGVPFILWLLAGILPWFFVADTLVICGTSIRSNRHLVTKSVFPAATIPTFVETSFFVTHLLLLTIATAIFAVCGYISLYFVQILYGLVCLYLLMWVVSLLFSALVAVSRDFEYMLKSATQVLFWISPILWNVDRIANYPIIYYIVRLNPIGYVISVYRNAFLGGWFWTDLTGTLCFWVEMVILALVGAFVFKKLEREFADIL
ncbi:MAG: ABC transporter permease [Clostridia bacterium]|nr:ABC transporter permease [Clostridia bacterium]